MGDQIIDIAINELGSFIPVKVGYSMPVTIVSGTDMVSITNGKLDVNASVSTASGTVQLAQQFGTWTIATSPSSGAVSLSQQFGEWSVGVTSGQNINAQILGTAQVNVTNSSLDVNTTTADYISIVGSPNYRLPVVGSVEVSNFPTTQNVDVVSGEVITVQQFGTWTTNIASGQLVNAQITNVLPIDVALTSGDIVLSQQFGTWTVNADTTTADYISIVGSPAYDLPVAITSGDIVLSQQIGTYTVDNVSGDGPFLSQQFGTWNVGVTGSVFINSGVVLAAQINNTVSVDNISGDGPFLSQQFGTWNVGISAGTNMIGSVKETIYHNLGSYVTFDWTTALTGSVILLAGTNNQYNITDVILSSSGANLVTLFWNADNTSNRISKTSLVPGGGFVNNYTKPLRGPNSGSLMITTAIAVPGYITVNGFITP